MDLHLRFEFRLCSTISFDLGCDGEAETVELGTGWPGDAVQERFQSQDVTVIGRRIPGVGELSFGTGELHICLYMHLCIGPAFSTVESFCRIPMSTPSVTRLLSTWSSLTRLKLSGTLHRRPYLSSPQELLLGWTASGPPLAARDLHRHLLYAAPMADFSPIKTISQTSCRLVDTAAVDLH